VSLRTDRIGEQLRGELAKLLREDLTDPRVGMLTLTRVDVAPDLSHAVVFWSPLTEVEDVDLEGIEEGLESASGYLRSRLAKLLSLRRMPALRFRHDPSLVEGSRMLALLRSLPEVREDSVSDPDTADGVEEDDGE
jgi:ribosome-binding factor A